jgi:hypothetical protein
MDDNKKIDKDLADIKTAVAVVKNDIGSFKDIISKMDKTIDKLSEIAEEVRRVVLLHENRLSQHEADYAAQKLIFREYVNDQVQLAQATDKRLVALEKVRNLAIGAAVIVSAIIAFTVNFLKSLFIG